MTASSATHYRWDDIPEEELKPDLRRRLIPAERMTIGHVYLDQWHRLRDAASRFPPQLVDANSAAHPVAPPAGTSATTVWFNRTHHEVDLAELRLGRA